MYDRVSSVLKGVAGTGDRWLGRGEGRRKNLTLRTKSLASMRRQCPAFVPFSTNICSQKRKISISPELHENINASSSVRTFTDGVEALKERAIPT